MPDPQEKPWSDNPNAPNITYNIYFAEKSKFAGILISSILYGIMIVLFLQCMAALFNPGHRRGERIKWGLVSYTAVMFSLATVFTALVLDIQSVSYIDNREFPGAEGVTPPGPLGYRMVSSAEALDIIPGVVFALSNWLADGFLLYRCYFIYSENIWAIAFPCLMYLGSVVMGIICLDQPDSVSIGSDWATIPYFSISLSLNVLLTLMIVIRLILYARNVRTVMGGTESGGLYKASVTMFIESCVLYAVSSLLALVLIGVENDAAAILLFILPQTQVIGPLFVIHRVANKSALTSESLISGRLSSFKAKSRGELAGGSSAVPGGDPASSVDERETNTGELEVGVETTNNSLREEVY